MWLIELFTLNNLIRVIDFFRLLTIRNKYGFPYQNISILGIILFFISLGNLYHTFVPAYVYILIIGISSIIITLLFWKFYTKNFHIIWAFIHNLMIGLILVAIFLETNKVLASEHIDYKTYKITNLKHKESNGKRKKLTLRVIVNINNQQKSFNLSNVDAKKILGRINNWKAEVGLQKGFFGYTFITSINALD